MVVCLLLFLDDVQHWLDEITMANMECRIFLGVFWFWRNMLVVANRIKWVTWPASFPPKPFKFNFFLALALSQTWPRPLFKFRKRELNRILLILASVQERNTKANWPKLRPLFVTLEKFQEGSPWPHTLIYIYLKKDMVYVYMDV